MPAKQNASSSSSAPAPGPASSTPSAEPNSRRPGNGASSRSRDQARVVRRYLAALEAERKGGKRRLSESIGNRILKIDELLVTADPLTRLHLTQERIDLHGEQIRYANGAADDVSSLEKQFIKVARSYADRVGIGYAAWRQVGVDTEVLERAGITRAAPRPTGAPGVAAPSAADGDVAEQTALAVDTPALDEPDPAVPAQPMRRKRAEDD
jgi:hypothetical protein